MLGVSLFIVPFLRMRRAYDEGAQCLPVARIGGYCFSIEWEALQLATVSMSLLHWIENCGHDDRCTLVFAEFEKVWGNAFSILGVCYRRVDWVLATYFAWSIVPSGECFMTSLGLLLHIVHCFFQRMFHDEYNVFQFRVSNDAVPPTTMSMFFLLSTNLRGHENVQWMLIHWSSRNWGIVWDRDFFIRSMFHCCRLSLGHLFLLHFASLLHFAKRKFQRTVLKKILYHSVWGSFQGYLNPPIALEIFTTSFFRFDYHSYRIALTISLSNTTRIYTYAQDKKRREETGQTKPNQIKPKRIW